MKRWKFIRGIPALALLSGIVLVTATRPAQAAMELRLSDSLGNSITITDGGVNDFNPLTGAITYIGSIGAFNLTVSTGESKGQIGSATDPMMDLNVAASKLSGSAADTLTIELTDTDFIEPVPDGTLHDEIGGTLGKSVSSVTSQAFLGSNTEFDESGIHSPLQTFTTSPYSGSNDSNYLGLTAPFSMTVVDIITAGVGAGSASFDHSAMVDPAPEPGTVISALTGLMLPLGAAAVRRFRHRRV